VTERLVLRQRCGGILGVGRSVRGSFGLSGPDKYRSDPLLCYVIAHDCPFI